MSNVRLTRRERMLAEEAAAGASWVIEQLKGLERPIPRKKINEIIELCPLLVSEDTVNSWLVTSREQIHA